MRHQHLRTCLTWLCFMMQLWSLTCQSLKPSGWQTMYCARVCAGFLTSSQYASQPSSCNPQPRLVVKLMSSLPAVILMLNEHAVIAGREAAQNEALDFSVD